MMASPISGPMRGFAVLAIALGAAFAPPLPPQIVTFPSGTLSRTDG